MSLVQYTIGLRVFCQWCIARSNVYCPVILLHRSSVSRGIESTYRDQDFSNRDHMDNIVSGLLNLCLKYLLLTIWQAITVLYRFLTVHITFKSCQFTVSSCFILLIARIAHLHILAVDKRWRYRIVPWNALNVVDGIFKPALKYASLLWVSIEHAVWLLK